MERSLEDRGGVRRGIYHLLSLAFFTSLVAHLTTVYTQLPERVPLHFGINGTPDRYGDKSGEFVFILIGAPLFLNILLYGLAWFVPRSDFWQSPYVNLPAKRQIALLAPEMQKQCLGLVQEMFYALAAILNGLFFSLEWTISDFMLSQRGQLNVGIIWMWIAIAVLIPLLYSWQIGRRVRRLLQLQNQMRS